MIKRVFFACILMMFIALNVSAQKPEMIEVPGGEYYMGNDYSNSTDEAPEHKVILNDFLIGKYEVTFDEFDMFCMAVGLEKPDDGGFGRGKLPVANLSWQSAIMYCNWLSAKEGLDKYYAIKRDSSNYFNVKVNEDANGYRLPTEAEWEYAARGGKDGKTTSYSGSNNVDEVAWYKMNADLTPHEVGTKKPNELGIHDMTGNAWEWCYDIYGKNYYSESEENNPKGPRSGAERVYRGGNWNSTLDFLRLTSRFHFAPNKDYGLIGMRLARNK